MEMTWGEAIRKIRMKEYLSQKDFAKTLKCCNVSVCRYEKGFEPNVKVKRKLKPYLEKYGIKIAEEKEN